MAAVNNVPQLVDKKGAGMERYYLKCIKDGPFQLKTAKGDDKPESQWTPDERRVGVQDQHLISTIMSCLLDDIMESVISYEKAKATWTDLVHSFEGPSDTRENKIMDLKLVYQTFRAKPTKSLSHTYTRYKTLLNELANDCVNLSKHEINVGFVNSLLEKWLTFSQGPRNAGHTQTLDLADIYGRDFQENSDDEVDERYSEEYLRDLDIDQANPKIQKYYKAEYKKMKSKLALLEANPSTSQTSKTFQPKNKCLVAETFDWDEEEVLDDEEVTHVKVLMALANDELTVGKNHARNDEWIDITIRKRHIREPIWYLDSGCSRSMTGVKSYLHKYVEQLVAFVNSLKYNLISISQLCDAKYTVQFDDKKGTIFNANKEIILVTPRRNDVYALDMSSLTPNGACLFAKASESVNWLWHKRLSHLNFKNINKLSKQNKVLGLPSLDIQRINLAQHVKKGSTIELHSKLNKIGLSGTENKNKTVIEAARTILNGSVLSKHLWTKAVRIACYTQNKSIIVKRHDKTPYEIFKERIPDISYFHVFGCPVFIHNHKDHLGRFDAKADDGYFLGYSFISEAFKDSWSKDQHVKLVNIIGDPGEGMLTRSMATKLTAASASKCLFADFLFEIEPKKVSEAIKHLRWVNAMQEELNKFYKNKVWTPVLLLYGKITIGSKWVFRKKKDEPVARRKPSGYSLLLLNDKLKEEVYVKQPPSFESSEFPNYVWKLDKALYGLKQAPKVYVDDIIFGSTSYKLCKQFEKLMTKKFEMSMIRELTHFLGLQIKQDDKGISICQEQYTRNLLKKYKISDSSLVKTPMVPLKNLVLCARYQSNPKESHLTAMKRILRYLKEKAPQVLAKYLVENWFVGVLRNNSQWLCPQLRLNMLLMLAYDPNPPADNFVVHPLKEYLIKFSVMNGKPFNLDFNTFRSSTGLDYNKGKYVDHPSPKAVKTVLRKIATNASYLDKTLVLENSFPVAWRILFTFMIQVLSRNYSSIEQTNSIQ
ncbi:retrovirus-related pol polyprotein from transposon TNT 1-94 [Tanacetum coccineum]